MLEAKAAEYRQARSLRQLDRADLTISKTGHILPDSAAGGGGGGAEAQSADQSIVEVTRANRQVYYQGYHVSLPTTFGDQKFFRTITDEEFILADPTTGEIVLSFPLPMIALRVSGRYVASYAIRGVHMSHPTKNWQRKHAEFLAQFDQRQEALPEVFDT